MTMTIEPGAALRAIFVLATGGLLLSAQAGNPPPPAAAGQSAAPVVSGVAPVGHVSPYVLAAQRRAQVDAAVPAHVSPLTLQRTHRLAGHARQP
jgi:hypothetical protein